MSRLKGSRLCRIIAVILAAIAAFVAVAAGLASIVMFKSGFYLSQREHLKESALRYRVFCYARDIANSYPYSDHSTDNAENTENLAKVYPNVYFEIKDRRSGEVLMSNYKGQSFRYSESAVSTFYEYDVEENEYGDLIETKTDRLRSIEVTVYVKEKTQEFDAFVLFEWVFDTAYSMRHAIPVVCIVSTIVFLLLCVYIIISAGHRNGIPGITLSFYDKIPFDLSAALYIGLIIFQMLVWDSIRSSSFIAKLFSIAVFLFSDILLGIACLGSFAARCKAGVLIKGSLIYMILCPVANLFRRLFKSFLSALRSLPLTWKSAVLFIAFSLLDIILIILTLEMPLYFFVFAAEKIACFVFIINYSGMMKKLQTGCAEISKGNLDYKIDTTGMSGELKLHGENLNSIGDGLSLAVDGKMKSERLKTELITNVSHDIKTPLTSIINYVDLLKSEKSENEKINEYIKVLERQSSRLKKLIEDLIEASKASTGNITVNREKLELGVLLGQALGEYVGRANAASLELILIKPAFPVCVMADGRLMWRIIDNLMSNICKYTMAGTRVYINLEKKDNTAKIILRNISRLPLSITEEELFERFVRGDSSRSTEGSGLGLSIARSLANLQGGELNLAFDGDLFKAILSFPCVPDEAEASADEA